MVAIYISDELETESRRYRTSLLEEKLQHLWSRDRESVYICLSIVGVQTTRMKLQLGLFHSRYLQRRDPIIALSLTKHETKALKISIFTKLDNCSWKHLAYEFIGAASRDICLGRLKYKSVSRARRHRGVEEDRKRHAEFPCIVYFTRLVLAGAR